MGMSNGILSYLESEIEQDKGNNKDKIEESKEKGNKIIKNNSNNNSINFNDIETTDLNIFKLHLLKRSFPNGLNIIFKK